MSPHRTSCTRSRRACAPRRLRETRARRSRRLQRAARSSAPRAERSWRAPGAPSPAIASPLPAGPAGYTPLAPSTGAGEAVSAVLPPHHASASRVGPERAAGSTRKVVVTPKPGFGHNPWFLYLVQSAGKREKEKWGVNQVCDAQCRSPSCQLVGRIAGCTCAVLVPGNSNSALEICPNPIKVKMSPGDFLDPSAGRTPGLPDTEAPWGNRSRCTLSFHSCILN
ncbi:PREDICTED: uncharacterized protein LOC108523904 isoform X2 [Rhinopithecus bieti]|uniref:uncharacterized protein LOC108523904 isoform X2 n=1 Tax=Rhinopithecus bieti TaxID=61621 RepID=UPI00083BAB1E|nr:PREDICTED: uncharacterized protein LOC108523904 isoform X2 [Rhinopithecus bieti]